MYKVKFKAPKNPFNYKGESVKLDDNTDECSVVCGDNELIETLTELEKSNTTLLDIVKLN